MVQTKAFPLLKPREVVVVGYVRKPCKARTGGHPTTTAPPSKVS